MDEIYARMPEWVIGVEDWMWGDFLAFYLDESTWQRYSRKGYPIENDEVCRYWEVFKVEFYDKRWIKYKILSRRPDDDATS